MENFIIGIPTYKRAEKQPTLEYLAGMGIPKAEIYLFIQTASDRREYSRYEDLANIVLKPANGVAEARNNILRELSPRANLLMFDDDVTCLSRLTADGSLKALKTREEFSKNMNMCFSTAKKAGVELFGLYPVHNSFFMDRSISTKVTVNTVLGFAKGTQLRLDESWKAKEDIEMCGRILADGGRIYRYNFLAPNAKHRTNDGGCKDVWATDANRKAAEALCEKFPEIFAINSTKPNEVRMILRDEKLRREHG